MEHRHVYTKDQLTQYFERINLPASKRIYDVKTSLNTPEEKLRYLTVLQKHHLCKVPWENLTQHYSWHNVVNVKPAHLFTKMVLSAGRGGYCMETNYFFHLILCSLQFDAYMVGSRIYRAPTGTFGGFTHVVNIVTIGGRRYLLDGGFGPSAPPRAFAIAHGTEAVQIEPARMRLLYEPMAEHVDRGQRVWKYQYRKNEEHAWETMYCFLQAEFTPADVETMNFAPWLSRRSFFTHKVVAVRFTTDREIGEPSGPGSPGEDALDEGEIDGAITLNHDHLTWRRHGKIVASVQFKDDSQRVDALEKYFGIVLDDADREAIVGTAAYILEGPLTGVTEA